MGVIPEQGSACVCSSTGGDFTLFCMCENSCLESDGNSHKGYHSREGLVRTSIDSPHWHLRDLPQHWWHNRD